MANVSCVRCGFVFDSSATKNCPECGVRAPLAYTHCGKPGRKNQSVENTNPKSSSSSVSTEGDKKKIPPVVSETPFQKNEQNSPSLPAESESESVQPALTAENSDYTSACDVEDLVSAEIENESTEPIFDEPSVEDFSNEISPPEDVEESTVELQPKEETSHEEQHHISEAAQNFSEKSDSKISTAEPNEHEKYHTSNAQVEVFTPDTHSSWIKKTLSIPEPMKLEKVVAKTDFNSDFFYDDLEGYDNYDAELIAKSTILKIIGWVLLGIVFIYAMLYNVA